MRPIPMLVLAAVVAGTLAVVPSVEAQQPKPFYGVRSQGGIQHLQARDFDLMRQARVGTLRISANRDQIETGGRFNWQHVDRAVGLAAARGIRTLPVINQHGGPRTKPQRRALARFAGAMAGRYGPGGEFWRRDYGRFSGGAQPRPILAWQILNEQNSRSHWGARPRPRLYGRALKLVSRAIRRSHRRAEIVLGGMFGRPGGKGSVPASRYLKGLYRVKGIKRAFKTAAVHPYSRNIKGIRRQIVQMRKVMRGNKHRRAGIRVTEIGWSSERGRHRLGLKKGPKGQAGMLRKSFRLLRKNRKRWKVRGLNWYAWQDITAQPGGGRGICQWCPDAGLVTVNRSPKPSYRAFRRASRR